ncbi:MAG: HAMP domain-containing protein [Chloroflexi bacterium]|nr:HAMP domain-containing protein [Chloroflexota bacterium]
MSVQLLGGPPYLGFFPQGRIGGYALLLLYVFAALAILALTYREWLKLNGWRWGLFVLLLVLAPAFELVLLRLPGDVLLPPPGLPQEPHGAGLALLGAVPIVLAGGLLGVGPALVVGFAAGLTRGLLDTFSLLTPFETAFLAALTAAFLRQSYRGRPAAWLRHPILAATLSAGLIWPVTFLGLWAYSPVGGLAGLDYVTALWTALAPALIGEAAIGGVLGEVALVAAPQAWPPRDGVQPPPYARSLNRQLLFTLIPLTVVGIAVLFWADTRIAINVATRVIVDQMGRDAQNAATGIPFFVQTGRGLIRDVAHDERLLDPATRQARLEQNLRSIPYFRQLVFFDANLTPVASYPVADVTAIGLSPDEQQFMELALQGVPQQTTVYPDNPNDPIQLSFIAPVGEQGNVKGVLLGRADLISNPLMQPVTNSLQGLLVGAGQGFIVDERGRIIYHPDRSQLMQEWRPETSGSILTSSVPNALAYEDRASDGTRRLVFYLPVAGHPWSVVITVPYQVVLSLATQISTQILLILVLIGAIGLILISFLANRLTHPLESLSRASARIAEGELDRPVDVSGEDEVGRLGLALEQMRERLKARIEELGLLLGVSRSVAENLNLDDALPPILQGALTATGAGGVRLLIPPDYGEGPSNAPTVFALGPTAPLMAPLDRDILIITRDEGAVTIENVARARTVLDVGTVAGRIQALIALPLRHEATFYGAMWLGYDKPHIFSESEVNFLTTLAGQAAVAVANTKLFEAAEGRRQRLSAILASTPDAVIVTDRLGRILLLNPAAEAAFGLMSRPATGRPLQEVIDRPELTEVLLGAPGSPERREVPLPDGRTLYASASTIVGGEGAALGRVAVLRDVTHFKELEQLKTEFVATVSHDLRAPLTFMRGYATMLPMVGTLNVKQKDFADKIIVGIEQMTGLIDNLLDLNRIEAGVGLVREACRIDELIKTAVEPLRGHAVNKQLALNVELPRNLPSISGDPTLLRQALANLVDNAIKYTPQGGSVKVVGELRDENLILAVSDTGVGIAQADQVRLFEKFYRVKQRDTMHIKGSGLGLAIVKSVAERHGGRVWVESRLGRGSTFYMAIPANGK